MLPDEWQNFKERMKSLNPSVKLEELWEYDFLEGGTMQNWQFELVMWASCRGQLLGRTVAGLMRNAKVGHFSSRNVNGWPIISTASLLYANKLVCLNIG